MGQLAVSGYVVFYLLFWSKVFGQPYSKKVLMVLTRSTALDLLEVWNSAGGINHFSGKESLSRELLITQGTYRSPIVDEWSNNPPVQVSMEVTDAAGGVLWWTTFDSRGAQNQLTSLMTLPRVTDTASDILNPKYSAYFRFSENVCDLHLGSEVITDLTWLCFYRKEYPVSSMFFISSTHHPEFTVLDYGSSSTEILSSDYHVYYSSDYRIIIYDSDVRIGIEELSICFKIIGAINWTSYKYNIEYSLQKCHANSTSYILEEGQLKFFTSPTGNSTVCPYYYQVNSLVIRCLSINVKNSNSGIHVQIRAKGYQNFLVGDAVIVSGFWSEETTNYETTTLSKQFETTSPKSINRESVTGGGVAHADGLAQSTTLKTIGEPLNRLDVSQSIRGTQPATSIPTTNTKLTTELDLFQSVGGSETGTRLLSTTSRESTTQLGVSQSYGVRQSATTLSSTTSRKTSTELHADKSQSVGITESVIMPTAMTYKKRHTEPTGVSESSALAFTGKSPTGVGVFHLSNRVTQFVSIFTPTTTREIHSTEIKHNTALTTSTTSRKTSTELHADKSQSVAMTESVIMPTAMTSKKRHTEPTGVSESSALAFTGKSPTGVGVSHLSNRVTKFVSIFTPTTTREIHSTEIKHNTPIGTLQTKGGREINDMCNAFENNKGAYLWDLHYNKANLEEIVQVGLCVCKCYGSSSNMTDEEIAWKIHLRKRESQISKTNLTSYNRRLTSAEDSRVSASCVGYMGVFILIALVGILILCDLPRCWNFLSSRRQSLQSQD